MYNRKIGTLNFPSTATPFWVLFTDFVTVKDTYKRKLFLNNSPDDTKQGMVTLISTCAIAPVSI